MPHTLGLILGISTRRHKIVSCDSPTCELARITHPYEHIENTCVLTGPFHRACPALSIRIMTGDDVSATVEWARREGWNPGHADGGPFQYADQEGFFMGYLAEHRAVSISSVRYGDNYGFIGFCICAPDCRGRGYSLVIFKRAMDHLEGRVIGLDAVASQEPKYATQGFVTAHELIRFKGKVIWRDEDDEDVQHDDSLVVESPRENCMESLLEYDAQHFPAARERFVRAWVHNPGHVVRVAMRNGKVEGYGVWRPSEDGARVGPLFATSSSVASMLLRAITADAPELEVCVDVPKPNLTGLELVKRAGLTRLCTFKRMYRGKAPDLPIQSIFASTTTLELG